MPVSKIQIDNVVFQPVITIGAIVLDGFPAVDPASLSGAAVGTGTASASINLDQMLSASAYGFGVAGASIELDQPLIASAHGSGVASASIELDQFLSGYSVGAGIAVASIELDQSLSSAATGVGTASASIETGFDVLALTGIKGWGKTNDLSTITDTAGSVSQIDDKSGNGNHWTQPTASKQPQTGVATVNGKNVVSFSGGTEHMINTWVPPDENWSVACVRRGAQIAGGSSLRHVIVFSSGASSSAAASMNAQRLGVESDNKLSYWAKNGSPLIYSTILWAENQVSGLIMNWRKNTDVTTYIDGSVATNTGDTTLAPTEISLMGSSYESSRGCIGDVCETIFGEGTLTPTEITGITQYFADEWGTA